MCVTLNSPVTYPKSLLYDALAIHIPAAIHIHKLMARDPPPFPLERENSLDGRGLLRQTALPQAIGNDECQLKRLRSIQAWVAVGVIAGAQVLKQQIIRPTNALGHVLTGHFQMHSSGVGPLLLMDIEERPQLSLHN